MSYLKSQRIAHLNVLVVNLKYMDIELLKRHIEEKLILVQKHPTNDLFIYNYSPTVQYEKKWDEITLMCRGLILDSNYNTIARPFKKFFNIEEHDKIDIPNTSFDVYEKMDGSLGILYWADNKPFIATRGSFTSDQAIHATELLYKKYSHTFDKLDKNLTYLFEIIYPENRIVVDYGKMDDLVLLTIIDIKTGDERLEDVGFPIVKIYDGINNLQELKNLEESNKEGFVIKFKNGFRIKIKFSEYLRLHRIVTGVSTVVIWKHLSDNMPLDALLDRVPDEFYDWVNNIQKSLLRQFNEILLECKSVFKVLDTRKETAIYFKTQKYPSILFMMLDNKNVNKAIWYKIKPAYSKPFKNTESC